MIRTLLTLALAGLAGIPASADVANLSWQVPLTRVDGSPVELGAFTVYAVDDAGGIERLVRLECEGPCSLRIVQQ